MLGDRLLGYATEFAGVEIARALIIVCPVFILLHGFGCADDETTIEGGTMAPPEDAGAGDDLVVAVTCRLTPSCSSCISAQCCPGEDSCGGLVDAPSDEPDGTVVRKRFRAYDCALSCLPECYEAYRASPQQAESDLPADEIVRRCASMCAGAGQASFEMVFLPYAEDFFACVAPPGALQEDLSSGVGGCLAECAPAITAGRDDDAGGI